MNDGGTGCNRRIEMAIKHACLLVGGPILAMPVSGKMQAFEMHPHCGPSLVHKVSHELLSRDPSKAFWDAFERWDLDGRKLNGTTCVVPQWCDRCLGLGVVAVKGMAEECPECRGGKIIK